MPLDNDKLKKLVNEFTSLTIGMENPEGMSFLTCFPISILLDLHQIDNSISYGVAPRNNSLVNHCWLTLDSEGTILDPTIRQFDLNIESTYIGKLDENDITKNFEPIYEPVQDCFDAAYNIWAEPLINKQPRTIRREPEFELKMNFFNVKTAAILNSYISKIENGDQIMSSVKCQRYFSPIFKFVNEKSNPHDNIFFNLKQEMPHEFTCFKSIEKLMKATSKFADKVKIMPMRKINLINLLLYFSCFAIFSSCSQSNKFNGLQEGDLLFQNLNCGELCDAIESVTHGVDGKDFSHCAMVVKINDSLKVVEAIGEKVQVNSLNAFFARSGDTSSLTNITVGRVKNNFEALILKATDFAKKQIGQPYDDDFLMDNGKWYCSELLYQSFKEANNQADFFELEPMTFKDPKTNQFFPAWIEYYKQLNTNIPEGKPGINPGLISRSKHIQIIEVNRY